MSQLWRFPVRFLPGCYLLSGFQSRPYLFRADHMAFTFTIVEVSWNRTPRTPNHHPAIRLAIFREIVTIQLLGIPHLWKTPLIIAQCVLVILGGSTAELFYRWSSASGMVHLGFWATEKVCLIKTKCMGHYFKTPKSDLHPPQLQWIS